MALKSSLVKEIWVSLSEKLLFATDLVVFSTINEENKSAAIFYDLGILMVDNMFTDRELNPKTAPELIQKLDYKGNLKNPWRYLEEEEEPTFKRLVAQDQCVRFTKEWIEFRSKSFCKSYPFRLNFNEALSVMTSALNLYLETDYFVTSKVEGSSRSFTIDLDNFQEKPVIPSKCTVFSVYNAKDVSKDLEKVMKEAQSFMLDFERLFFLAVARIGLVAFSVNGLVQSRYIQFFERYQRFVAKLSCNCKKTTHLLSHLDQYSKLNLGRALRLSSPFVQLSFERPKGSYPEVKYHPFFIQNSFVCFASNVITGCYFELKPIVTKVPSYPFSRLAYFLRFHYGFMRSMSIIASYVNMVNNFVAKTDKIAALKEMNDYERHLMTNYNRSSLTCYKNPGKVVSLLSDKRDKLVESVASDLHRIRDEISVLLVENTKLKTCDSFEDLNVTDFMFTCNSSFYDFVSTHQGQDDSDFDEKVKKGPVEGHNPDFSEDLRNTLAHCLNIK